jgi:hypothetical protein
VDRKTLTIILSLALIACFFLPYLKFGDISASGFDIVTAPMIRNADRGIVMIKYVWLLIPLAAIILLIGALNNGHYFLGRAIWAFLPLLALAFVVAKIYRDAKSLNSPFSISTFAENFDISFWISLVLSLVLALYWPRQTTR